MGHSDPTETALVTHQEGNEGEKNGVKRGNRGFYGGKLLKRKGETAAVREKNVALTEVPRDPRSSLYSRCRRPIMSVRVCSTCQGQVRLSTPEKSGNATVSLQIRVDCPRGPFVLKAIRAQAGDLKLACRPGGELCRHFGEPISS
jgi:hypothetical protein